MDGTLNLDAIVVFARVADTASFRRAAEGLGVPRSTVSRRVFDLERQLGVRLLRRTTRSVSLTEAGATYLAACRPALESLAAAALAVTSKAEQTHERLRITASVSFGERSLAPVIDEFLQTHKGVDLEVVLVDRHVDVLQEGFDFAFRAGAVGDASLVARELARASVLCVASPTYLDRHRRIARPQDLAQHECIVYPPLAPKARWEFRARRRSVFVPIGGRLVVTSVELALKMAIRGLGVTRLPRPIVEDALQSGALREVLRDAKPAETRFFIVYPVGSQSAPHRRAFLELALRRLKPAPSA